MNWNRVAATISAVALLLIGICLVPLPRRVVAPVSIQPAGAQPVYVPVAGTLLQAARPAGTVQAGQQLARLRNLALDQEIAQLEGAYKVQELRLETLKRRQVQDRRTGRESAGGRIPAARQILADLAERLRQKRNEQKRLTILSPASGVVLPPRPTGKNSDPDQLPGWSGTPLDEQNLGCRLQAGTTLCWIGDPQRLEALLVVAQNEIRDVRPGQRVRIRLDELPAATVRGQVAEIAELDLTEVPPELSAKRLVSLRPDGEKTGPQVVSYQVRAALQTGGHPIPLRATGRAKIEVAPESLGQRLYEYLCRTFRMEL